MTDKRTSGTEDRELTRLVIMMNPRTMNANTRIDHGKLWMARVSAKPQEANIGVPIPGVLKERLHDDREEASTDAPAAEHGREGESDPLPEPVRHYHVAHVKDDAARELAVFNMSVSLFRDVAEHKTDPNAETLAKQKMPIFGALCREEHARDEQRGCQEYGQSEVSQVE